MDFDGEEKPKLHPTAAEWLISDNEASSEDEIFFGPITEREKLMYEKRGLLNRKTMPFSRRSEMMAKRLSSSALPELDKAEKVDHNVQSDLLPLAPAQKTGMEVGTGKPDNVKDMLSTSTEDEDALVLDLSQKDFLSLTPAQSVEDEPRKPGDNVEDMSQMNPVKDTLPTDPLRKNQWSLAPEQKTEVEVEAEKPDDNVDDILPTKAVETDALQKDLPPFPPVQKTVVNVEAGMPDDNVEKDILPTNAVVKDALPTDVSQRDLLPFAPAQKTGLEVEVGHHFDTEEKNMLQLALQRRFEKHKVDLLPDLCDLNLDDTAAESECYNTTHQFSATLDNLSSYSMPCLTDSSNDISSALLFLSQCKSAANATDLDTTALFLEKENSCFTPSIRNHAHDEGHECRSGSMLTTDNLSSVSADEDGGFLSGLTKVALYHAELNREITPVLSRLPAAKEAEHVLQHVPETKANNAWEERQRIESKPANDDLLDFSKSLSDDSGESLNNTLDEINMLEAFGAHYMVDAEKQLMKRGMENSINVSLTTEQQELFDSVSKTNPNVATKKPQNCKLGIRRDISTNFETCPSRITSGFVASSPPSKKVLASNSKFKPTEDFKFPKPLTSVGGSQSKIKYRHETTPIKPPPKVAPPGSKFFSGCTPKGCEVQLPVQEIPKSRLRVPCSGAKKAPDFKQIQSPIGRYINDSPVPSFVARRHAPFAGMQKNKKILSTEVKEKVPSENIDVNNLTQHMSLPPQKSYQSTSSLKMVTPTRTKLPVLNGKIKQLVNTPKAVVLKHTGRVKVADLPSSSPLSKKPPKIDDSCFSDKTMEAEVSVVLAKEAMKTSSMK